MTELALLKSGSSGLRSGLYGELRSFVIIGTVLYAACVFSACSVNSTPPVAQEIIIEREPLPEGIEQRCWREPEVRAEQEGPGVDPEGKWYRPAHKSVRMVKGGRWVDCKTGEELR